MGNVLPTQKTYFSPSFAQFSRNKQDIFYPNFFHESCNSISLFIVDIRIIPFGSL